MADGEKRGEETGGEDDGLCAGREERTERAARGCVVRVARLLPVILTAASLPCTWRNFKGIVTRESFKIQSKSYESIRKGQH